MCDYCNNITIARVKVHNNKWELCPKCLVKNRVRLRLTKLQVLKFLKDYENMLNNG